MIRERFARAGALKPQLSAPSSGLSLQGAGGTCVHALVAAAARTGATSQPVPREWTMPPSRRRRRRRALAVWSGGRLPRAGCAMSWAAAPGSGLWGARGRGWAAPQPAAHAPPWRRGPCAGQRVRGRRAGAAYRGPAAWGPRCRRRRRRRCRSCSCSYSCCCRCSASPRPRPRGPRRCRPRGPAWASTWARTRCAGSSVSGAAGAGRAGRPSSGSFRSREAQSARLGPRAARVPSPGVVSGPRPLPALLARRCGPCPAPRVRLPASPQPSLPPRGDQGTPRPPRKTRDPPQPSSSQPLQPFALLRGSSALNFSSPLHQVSLILPTPVTQGPGFRLSRNPRFI